jgi:hypothetical protein
MQSAKCKKKISSTEISRKYHRSAKNMRLIMDNEAQETELKKTKLKKLKTKRKTIYTQTHKSREQ